MVSVLLRVWGLEGERLYLIHFYGILWNISCFHMQFLMCNSKYILEVESGHFQKEVPLTNPFHMDYRCVTTTGTAIAIQGGRPPSVTSQAMVAVLTVGQLT